MIALADFKAKMNVETLTFGRKDKNKNFSANVPLDNGVTLTIYASKSKTDMSKPLFIIQNDGSTNEELKGTLWAVNSGWKAEHTL